MQWTLKEVVGLASLKCQESLRKAWTIKLTTLSTHPLFQVTYTDHICTNRVVINSQITWFSPNQRSRIDSWSTRGSSETSSVTKNARVQALVIEKYSWGPTTSKEWALPVILTRYLKSLEWSPSISHKMTSLFLWPHRFKWKNQWRKVNQRLITTISRIMSQCWSIVSWRMLPINTTFRRFTPNTSRSRSRFKPIINVCWSFRTLETSLSTLKVFG